MMLNKQQLCAELGVSESTVRKLEQQGLPYTPVGARSHRYDLEECKAWLREATSTKSRSSNAIVRSENPQKTVEFIAACKRVKLRVMPSK